jgi:arginase
MRISLIEVPYLLGDERHGAAAGPERLVRGGAQRRLEAAGHDVVAERVARRSGPRAGNGPAASEAVNVALAASVRAATAAGRFPLVLAGSCDAALGIVGGLEHARCGIVWIDAHADFNTPESSVSGFFPGMTLAVLLGDCHRELWERVGDSAPVSEAATVLVGVRELSPATERARLEASAIRAVPWRDGEPEGDVHAALAALAGTVDEVYLHVDLDGLDPSVAPGIVDEPVPGGLSLGQLEDVVRSVKGHFVVKAAAITTYNPERDENGRTLRAALRVAELVSGRPPAPAL